ncbi:hypothetical protein ADICYQ_2945 [Cyclobacterium qasimii M12-11B]|uniref:Uncharacterized protein n=2 Tax=Cyclobacterium qasimii TaxID=1350429 RepID=S7WUV6_9BACT|nr:hypothetical protein ADICYQ_2945 [Cyclobacterium qasimii M12-11B]GEO23096.1 hypothetical protein CQA01_36300 [Cyclobacterium qasimii]
MIDYNHFGSIGKTSVNENPKISPFTSKECDYHIFVPDRNWFSVQFIGAINPFSEA